MIRQATIDDLEALGTMALRFAQESPFKNAIDSNKVLLLLEGFIEDANSIVLLYEDKEDDNPLIRDKENTDLINISNTTLSDITNLTNPLGFVCDIPNKVKGFLVGINKDFLLGTFKIASDICFYVSPEYRNSNIGHKLLSSFEEWAIHNNCKVVSMVGINSKVETLYEAQGYTLYEQAYMKVL